MSFLGGHVLKLISQAGEQKADYAQFLVKGGAGHLFAQLLPDLPPENGVHLVIVLIFIVELQIVGKVLGNGRKLDVLDDHVPVHRHSQALVDLDEPG